MPWPPMMLRDGGSQTSGVTHCLWRCAISWQPAENHVPEAKRFTLLCVEHHRERGGRRDFAAVASAPLWLSPGLASRRRDHLGSWRWLLGRRSWHRPRRGLVQSRQRHGGGCGGVVREKPRSGGCLAAEKRRSNTARGAPRCWAAASAGLHQASCLRVSEGTACRSRP